MKRTRIGSIEAAQALSDLEVVLPPPTDERSTRLAAALDQCIEDLRTDAPVKYPTPAQRAAALAKDLEKAQKAQLQDPKEQLRRYGG